VTRLAYAPTETIAHDTAAVYQFGYLTEDTRPKGQTAVTNAGNNFAVRWIRDAAGNWRFHRFIATSAPRPSAPTPTVQPIAAATGVRADAATIEQRSKDYADALRSNDPAKVLGFWAEDGRYLQPDIELNDQPAIARFVSEAYARARTNAVDLTSDELFLHDGVAYQLGTCSPCLVPGGAGRRYQYIARWKHGADGTWLIDRFLATLTPTR
jgi:ketosteroid isomerase-like protein